MTIKKQSLCTQLFNSIKKRYKKYKENYKKEKKIRKKTLIKRNKHPKMKVTSVSFTDIIYNISIFQRNEENIIF